MATNWNSDTPAAPANGINVVFAAEDSVHDAGQVNATAAIVGPGGTTEFLRADGTWASPGGGGGSFQNLVVLPQLGSGGVIAGYTVWVQIPASALLRDGSQVKLGIYVTSTNVVIAGAVIRRAAAFGTSFIDSTPFTWGSSATPTFGTTGLHLSDAISVAVDTAHDYWVLVYFDATSTGNVAVNTGLGTQTPDFIPGYQFGDQTATAMGSLSPAATYLKGIQQIVAQ